MTIKTKAALIAWNDANIKANNNKEITGPIHNTMNKDLIDSLVNTTDDNDLLGLFSYDSTRNYVVNQGVLYSNELYICTTNTTGAWNAAHWSLVISSDRDEFSFTNATIGVAMTLISGNKYQRTHNLNTNTPKFRLTRPNGEVFSEADLAFKIISVNVIELDFGGGIDTGTSYVLIEK